MADLELNPITGELDLVNGVNPLTVGAIQFDTAHTPITSAPGLIQWNSVDGTYDMGLLNSSVLQVGQETMFYGKASGAISNGDVCQFAGVQGDHILIKKAVGSEIEANPHFLVGVATNNIANGSFGYVTWFGKVNGIYTKTPANQDTLDWSAGDVLYFNITTGQMTKTMPSVPNRIITIAYVIKEQTGSGESGVIIVRPLFGVKLQDLDDVNGSSLVRNGQILLWNNDSQYFDFEGDLNLGTYGIRNTSGLLSVDPDNGFLRTSGSDWQAGIDYYYGTFVNRNNTLYVCALNHTSSDFDEELYYGYWIQQLESQVVDYNNCILYGYNGWYGMKSMLDFSNKTGLGITSNNFSFLNFDYGYLLDSLGAVTIDWVNKILYSTGGGQVSSIDWEGRNLVGGRGNTVLHWDEDGSELNSDLVAFNKRIGFFNSSTGDYAYLAYTDSCVSFKDASGNAYICVESLSLETKLGLVGTPSRSFIGDEDTGDWSSGANTYNISTGGLERIRVTDAGNVYIGVTSLSPVGGTGKYLAIGGLTNAILSLTGSKDWRITSNSGGAIAFRNETDNVNAFEIKSAGEMGVGMGSSWTAIAKFNVSDAVTAGTAANPMSYNALSTANTGNTGQVSYRLRDSATNPQTFARLDFGSPVITAGACSGFFRWNVLNAGTMQEKMAMGATSLVINDPGNDYDFRIEGDNDVNLLSLDAGIDAIGIGQSPVSSTKLSVSKGGTNTHLTEYALQTTMNVNVTDADETTGIHWGLNNQVVATGSKKVFDSRGMSGSVVVYTDTSYTYGFTGSVYMNPGSSKTHFRAIGGQLGVTISDHTVTGRASCFDLYFPTVTTGTIANAYGLNMVGFTMSGAGTITNLYGVNIDVPNKGATGTITNAYGLYIGDFGVAAAGTNRYALYTLGGGVVFNENGTDSDFRIEGDTNANLFFLDASADAIAIGGTDVSSGARFIVSGPNNSTTGTKSIVTILSTTLATDNISQNNQQIYTAWNPSANTSTNTMRGTVNQFIKSGSYNATSVSLANVHANYATPTATGSGNIQGMASFVSRAGADTGFSGTMTNCVGLWADSPLSLGGTITNSYGLYISKQKQSVVTNAWGIYQSDSADSNYFAGTISIVSDASKLNLGAGTDMDIQYDGTSGYIRTNLVSASDLNINCGTDKTIVLTESVWGDIDFPIIVRTTGAGIPTLTTFNGNITMPEWAVNDFNQCESQEFIHEWKEGTTCYWHIHLTTNGLDATDRYVKFELEYAYSAAGVWTFPAVYTTADVLIPANTADKTQIIIPITNFTPTGAKIGDHCIARLKRVAAAGTAPTNNPWIPMLQMHIEKDTVGSRQMTAK